MFKVGDRVLDISTNEYGVIVDHDYPFYVIRPDKGMNKRFRFQEEIQKAKNDMDLRSNDVVLIKARVSSLSENMVCVNLVENGTTLCLRSDDVHSVAKRSVRVGDRVKSKRTECEYTLVYQNSNQCVGEGVHGRLAILATDELERV